MLVVGSSGGLLIHVYIKVIGVLIFWYIAYRRIV